jgi:hypothetical protein
MKILFNVYLSISNGNVIGESQREEKLKVLEQRWNFKDVC